MDSNNRLRWVLSIIALIVLLAGCERALQEAPDPTPTVSGVVAPTVDAGTPSLLVSPTVDAGLATPVGTGAETPPADTGDPAVTPEPTAVPETAPPGEDIIHTVVAGDTLGSISEQYGIEVEAIAAANNLPNIHTLDVGQQLIIPLSGDIGSGSPDEDATAPPAEERVHIVRAGDTLYSIGRAYGFTIDVLAAYNNLSNPNDLEIGQQIRIPPDGYTAP